MPCSLQKSTDVLEECIGSFRINHTRNQQELENPEDEDLTVSQSIGGLLTDGAVLTPQNIVLSHCREFLKFIEFIFHVYQLFRCTIA